MEILTQGANGAKHHVMLLPVDRIDPVKGYHLQPDIMVDTRAARDDDVFGVRLRNVVFLSVDKNGWLDR